MPRKPYTEVKVGDVVHSHGVPLVVTTAPQQADRDRVAGGAVVWFVGTYQGDPVEYNGLAPFVTKAGDTWTFQRALPYAYLGHDPETGIHYQA